MANRIKKDDMVKIISGSNKGIVGKVSAVFPKRNELLIEKVGLRTRHVRKSQFNPQGGKKDIQVPMSLDKVALITNEKESTISRVGYRLNDKGKKIRIAKQQKNKEII